MKAYFIDEPDLEFGGGMTHPDIRFGLKNYGPFDAGKDDAPTELRLGIVGTSETIDGVSRWLESCGGGVPAKDSYLKNLFVEFPGFGDGTPLPAPITVASTAEITMKSVRELFKHRKGADAVKAAAELFLDHLHHVGTNKTANVLVCVPPGDIRTLMDRGDVEPEDEEDEEGGKASLDFHNVLKAGSLSLELPVQVIWPRTYGGKVVASEGETRTVQDEATRAWNLYVALYYKARGVPWRLVRDPYERLTCYVGVSFYHTLDRKSSQTSVAQVFNELGEGVILQGGTPVRSKEDRQLHLKEEDAFQLVKRSLENFKREHGTFPARVVIHKSTAFNDEEGAGMTKACEEKEIDRTDLLHLGKSSVRLFRSKSNPPLRGTLLSADDENHYLYTVGSVDFYRKYPGMYVPRTLHFGIERSSKPSLFLAEEMLRLSKMNWNNTQIYNSLPVTLDAAKKVGDLMKHVEGPVREVSYRYYM